MEKITNTSLLPIKYSQEFPGYKENGAIVKYFMFS